MLPRNTSFLVVACLAAGSAATAQRVVLGGIATPSRAEPEEGGPNVEMFESPNLDRFLRRARQFLDEEKFTEAIKILQTVIEGRTLEAVRESGEPESVANDGAIQSDPAPDKAAATVDERAMLADPSQTVFSADGRIYRPARRLCHEYLSGMPPAGLDLYQTQYEIEAQRLLEEGLMETSNNKLETVANRYFATLAAGSAMQALADRLMHQGQYRSAVQVLRDLSEIYPASNLKRLNINPLWCRFKIALCLRLAGESGAAVGYAQELAARYPDESLRVMGELQPVSGLAASPLFAEGDSSMVARIDQHAATQSKWLTPDTETMVPLWRHRFRGQNPYAEATSTRTTDSGVIFMGEGVVSNLAPPSNKYGTGTRVAFMGTGEPRPLAVFLEHYRLRIADAFTGVMRLEGNAEDEPPKPKSGMARARVPVYDWSLLDPVEDEHRMYIVVGSSKVSPSADPLKTNRVVAYDRKTCAEVWKTDAFLDGDDGYKDVTFLAAPIVFGERLLVPAMRRGAYSLQCIDRSSGKPIWCTRIHSGGSVYVKAPGTRVLMSGSLAYVLTNAGGIAAIDAFAGDLKWIRRYERSDPLRPRPVSRTSSRNARAMMGRQVTFGTQDLGSFLPSEMIAVGGTIVFAGCDSDMLLCIDGASGEPLWMVDGSSRYAPYDRLRYIIGSTSKYVFAAASADADMQVVCIELASGLLRWSQTVPGGSSQLTLWRGRGCIVDDHVLMPGDREVLALDVERKNDWRRISLPSFAISEEPLRGPNNLFCSGPWLGIAYAEGIEVYSTQNALLGLAETSATPTTKADYLVAADRREAAFEVLISWIASEREPSPASIGQLVSLASELALAHARDGVGFLDRVRPFARERQIRLQWHLARLEFFRSISDLRAYEEEQQRLYRYMEGKE